MSTASGRAHVELRLPADSAFVSVLRTTSAGLAARLDFTLDDVEDLRMAVGEACAIVLSGTSGGDLTAQFWFGERALTVRVSAPVEGASESEPLAPEDDFGWQVLSALASDAQLERTEGTLAVTMTVAALPLEPA
jgi:serine/threonine-protein kinase RsbW